jgi:hypothetical protein
MHFNSKYRAAGMISSLSFIPLYTWEPKRHWQMSTNSITHWFNFVYNFKLRNWSLLLEKFKTLSTMMNQNMKKFVSFSFKYCLIKKEFQENLIMIGIHKIKDKSIRAWRKRQILIITCWMSLYQITRCTSKTNALQQLRRELSYNKSLD